LIEDELVSLDELQEKIAEFDDYVQSSDVQAMQSKLPSRFCLTSPLIGAFRALSVLLQHESVDKPINIIVVCRNQTRVVLMPEMTHRE